jgi:putative transposase
VKFASIAQSVAFPIETMCRLLGVTRDGFNAWKKRPRPARAKADAQLAATIAGVHQRSRKTYGSPRARRAQSSGRGVGRKRVARLIRKMACKAAERRFKRTTDSRHNGAVAPNVLARDFTQAAPNPSWVRTSQPTDVTAIATGRAGYAWPSCSAVLASRSWLGDELKQRHHPRACSTGDGAASSPTTGWSSSPLGPRQPLRERGIPRQTRCSRCAAKHEPEGDCWDNSVAESFFATLRAELVDHEYYFTRYQAELFHRRLLQRRASSLARRLRQPDGVRIAIHNSAPWHSHGVNGLGGTSGLQALTWRR